MFTSAREEMDYYIDKLDTTVNRIEGDERAVSAGEFRELLKQVVATIQQVADTCATRD